MDAGMVGIRLASSAVAPLVRKLFVADGPGAGMVDRPVRVSRLVSFMGEKRTFNERDMRKLTAELVKRAVRAAGPHDPPVPSDEQQMVAETLMHTLHVLGELDMDDVQAVQLGPDKLAWLLRQQARRPLFLSEGGLHLHNTLLRIACLHILNFFTQRSTFVARTLVAQSQQLGDLVTKVDLLIERTPPLMAEDARFEARYAEYVVHRHGELTIYGIDLHHAREWPLDTAYLSLEAVESRQQTTPLAGENGAEWALAAPQPVDRALAGHDRVLLRGLAGSGKTTLVQWLAVTTARQDVSGGLVTQLLGRVPFVLPMRTLTRGRRERELPAPDAFLTAVGCLIADAQPAGWADRVLAAGRGLLLVDGVDEMPVSERERGRRWLRELLAAYPGSLCLVTARSSAVREDWLDAEGFTDLTLSPMRREDVRAFIHRWHRAARAEPDLERSLLEAVRTKPDLGRLATNPLMCALICALHRERRRFLPRGRKALYDAALTMMLERRDRERDMGCPSGLDLDYESQIRLLQKLAYWLIRNGRSELDSSVACDLIERLRPSMPQVAQQGSAEAVYEHLLTRSGLLREPAKDALDFVHRTFQDYLGAREAVEERDFDVLVSNAHLDQWEDVIRMAVAHGRPSERARLLGKLVERSDGETESVQARLYLVAMACLEHATQLDPAVREEVERRAAMLIPPRNIDEAKQLAAVGPVVLELLPGPEGLDEAMAVAHTACQIGTDAALPFLARFRDHPDDGVRLQLASHWDRFDTETYGREIIRHLVGDSSAVVAVRSTAELDVLSTMPEHREVSLQGDFTAEQITGALQHHPLQRMDIADNSVLGDLEFLTGFRTLRVMHLANCPEVADLSPLARLPVSVLHLTNLPKLKKLTGLSLLTRLETVGIHKGVDCPGLAALSREAPLDCLITSPEVRDLSDIRDFPTLTWLGLLPHRPPTPQSWRAIADLPTLSMLNLNSAGLETLVPTGRQLTRLRHLLLTLDRQPCDLQQVAELFPALEQLRVNEVDTLDLTPLATHPHLKSVTVYRPQRLLGADALPKSLELDVLPRPRTETHHSRRLKPPPVSGG